MRDGLTIFPGGRKNLPSKNSSKTINKTSINPSEETLDRIFFALSDRNRRKILKSISKSESTVGELAEKLGISLPGTLKHLGILKDAKLVDLEKNGRVRSCTFNPKGFNSAMTYIEEYQIFWTDKFDQIEKLLADSNIGTNHR